MINISFKDMDWLDAHGGRDTSDVYVDKVGDKYVLMRGSDGMPKPVYLPQNGQKPQNKIWG